MINYNKIIQKLIHGIDLLSIIMYRNWTKIFIFYCYNFFYFKFIAKSQTPTITQAKVE